jgi:AcrR family transcriptional regulator
MGRRSDHSRIELEALITKAGHAHMAEVGFARFSAREVAKRVGYSVGTIYNVFGSYDRLILAINARTLDLWTTLIETHLAAAGTNRLHALVRSYFAFAQDNPHSWSALYDHRLPADDPMPEWYRDKLARLFAIIESEIAAALQEAGAHSAVLARQLFAAVHGICALRLNGTLQSLGVADAEAMAIALVDQHVNAARLGR